MRMPSLNRFKVHRNVVAHWQSFRDTIGEFTAWCNQRWSAAVGWQLQQRKKLASTMTLPVSIYLYRLLYRYAGRQIVKAERARRRGFNLLWWLRAHDSTRQGVILVREPGPVPTYIVDMFAACGLNVYKFRTSKSKMSVATVDSVIAQWGGLDIVQRMAIKNELLQYEIMESGCIGRSY